jgi:hypothetical protein
VSSSLIGVLVQLFSHSGLSTLKYQLLTNLTRIVLDTNFLLRPSHNDRSFVIALLYAILINCHASDFAEVEIPSDAPSAEADVDEVKRWTDTHSTNPLTDSSSAHLLPRALARYFVRRLVHVDLKKPAHGQSCT